jgi:predicted metal-dependent peptidase
MVNIQEELTRAKIQIQLKSPFFSYLSLYLKFKVDNNCDTAYVTPRGEMGYNETFMEELYRQDIKGEVIQGLVIHELYHLAFLNLARVGTRDKRNWNIATDLINNTMLLKEGKYSLPKGDYKGLYADYNDNFEIATHYGIYVIEKVSEKNADMIYDELTKIQQEYQDRKEKGEGTTQQEQKQHDKEHDKYDNETEEQKEEKKKIGDNLLDNEYKGFDEHIYKEWEKLSEKEKKEVEKEWNDRVAEALAVAKMRGDIPKGIARMFEDLHKEKIDWKTLLNNYIINELPHDYSWCLEENTPIYTPKGKIKIKDLRQGRYVLGYKNGKICYSKIKSKFRSIVKKRYTIITNSGKKVVCSERHRFLTQRGYVRADELTKTDKIIGVKK